MTSVDTPYSKPINLKNATVLVTGGTSGIGLEFARAFLEHGSDVIICGRRQDALDAAKQKYPKLHTYQADVGNEQSRIKLVDTVLKNHPKINVLVNNAGIQRRVPLKDEIDNWSERQTEIDINCSGPVHLSSLFAKHFIAQPEAAIINITSGLAFVPYAAGPVYSATKAFIHNFTISQRWHFEQNTNVQVYEIAPPAVKSNLAGSHDFGEETDEFVNHVVERFVTGEKEIGYKMSEQGRKASREHMLKAFDGIVHHSQQQGYLKPYEKSSL